ncbi:PREDICTED: uncharacterized protein LOC107880709 [Prunus mume]|uniref:Uncharacterized protein LOC107880709 n=1 Tax=Prunus mume TaxID=102107 RepID=A0ABM1LLK9_PRUMU|nr:PREDICTED: uncharacterized protein LOC107880709 [Prunus mume]
MTDERRAAEAKRMNKYSKRRLMMGLQGKRTKRQAEAVPTPLTGVDSEDQTIADRLRQLNTETASVGTAAVSSTPTRGQATDATTSKAASKRPVTVDLEAKPAPKWSRQGEVPRVTLAAEDDDNSAEPFTIACPSKSVQFANHMILGSQMELSEIEELPKKLIREEDGRAFRLQASASYRSLMYIWLCVKRAITAAERAKKAYEDDRAKVAEVGQVLQAHANLVKDMQAAEREVGSDMADLMYRFKRYNPGQKLNLNFIADPPLLPEGVNEDMIEEYEGEDAPEEVLAAEGSAAAEAPADADATDDA